MCAHRTRQRSLVRIQPFPLSASGGQSHAPPHERPANQGRSRVFALSTRQGPHLPPPRKQQDLGTSASKASFVPRPASQGTSYRPPSQANRKHNQRQALGGSHRYLTHRHSHMEAHLTPSQEACQSQWPDAMPLLPCHPRLRRRAHPMQCRSRPHRAARQRRTRRTLKRHRHMSQMQPVQRQPRCTQSNNGHGSQATQNQPPMVTCG